MRRQILVFFTFVLSLFCSVDNLHAQTAAVQQRWVPATMAIRHEVLDNQGNKILENRSTGFLLEAVIGQDPRLFLVTNKHAVSVDGTKFTPADGSLTLEMHRLVGKTSESITLQQMNLAVSIRPRSSATTHYHSQREVDLALVDVTELIASASDLWHRSIPESAIGTPAGLEKEGIGQGTLVAVIGFPGPMVLRHEKTNFPIVRSGIISSDPRQNVRLNIVGFPPMHPHPVLLVDSPAIGGASGSPVFLFPTPIRFTGGGPSITAGPPPEILVGVVAGNTPLGMDLGVCVPAWKILDVLNEIRAKAKRPD